MRSRIVSLLIVVVVGVIGWSVYSNVYSDDTAVRQMAEAHAREKAGCGAKCVLKSIEGSRGLLNEQLQFEMSDGTKVLVECKRKYIGFGSYACKP
ncbi:MAG TPA: hypothetical protein VL326_31615 [Kofleriaceae bacterium]|nr:hypothetical protein [Kofleriaceae bacterium]